ncbi:peritrophin-1-like [Anopheles nili]|uniref:peritrophin-1-like n=1 Tax=Anopheles nili TaxID=185578 RepID=UPI00237A9DD4|nr:peritrophin-1-like [Anopheles nili]
MKGIGALILFATIAVAVKASDITLTCPETDDIFNPVHIPHFTDCSKFYKCFNGEMYEMDCPAGLQWNIEKDFCDYPEDANCERPLELDP